MSDHPPPSASESLQRLLAGNERFRLGRPQHPHQTPERRGELLGGQRPLAAVLGCSDSRVPPEIIFDCGLGDLFVVRVAGNTADEVALGTLEFAVRVVGVRLIVALGHDQCGAMAAAARLVDPSAAPLPGFGAAPPTEPEADRFAARHLGRVLERLRPAAQRALGQRGSLVDNAIDANVGLVVEQLRAAAPALAGTAHTELLIVGARYRLDSGRVEVLGL